MMATYAYQQNMFDGASEGYVKFNISPDLGTVVSAGTTITITGQAYHKSRANKCIEITTIASNTYRSAFVNVNIPKATVTNFTLKFQMWELSSAWGTSRVVNALINFTLWSGANCDGNGDGTFNTNSQAIRYLTYRISPAAKTVQFERYALSGSTYVKNDEGTKVMGKLAISLAEGRTVSDITTAKVVVASDAGTSQTITLSTAVLNAALTSNGYVESSPSLFSSITFNTAYNYTLTFTIGDAYDQAVFSVLVARAFANLHLSGLKTGGVAFGRFSSATLNIPKFESDFPAYLYGGVKDLGMNWVSLTPASGVTSPNSNLYGGGALCVAKVGGHVFIRGSVLAKSGALLTTLPAGYFPTDGNRYKLAACGGARIARIFVNGSGNLNLEWVRNMNGGGEYTTAVWVDCNFDYWID